MAKHICKCQDSSGTPHNKPMSAQEAKQDGMCNRCAEQVWAELTAITTYKWYHKPSPNNLQKEIKQDEICNRLIPLSDLNTNLMSEIMKSPDPQDRLIELSRETLSECCGNINPERGFADDY